MQWQNKELEQQLVETMNLLEKQHERHKHFLVLLLRQRKIENDEQNETIRLLTESSRQNQNENVLKTRIRQLEDEIDALTRDKLKKTSLERPKSADLPSTHQNDPISPRRNEISHRLKGNEHVVPTIPTRLRQTVSNADLPTNPMPPLTRRHVTPVRPMTTNRKRPEQVR